MPTLKRRTDAETKRHGKNNRAFYSSYRWEKLRNQFRKINPLCGECLKQGITKLGECVDHIRPIEKGGSKTDFSNLQTLCNKHHSEKTARENPKWSKKN